ncbi:hypothetical protein Tco_1067464 [Tanacetum coccineum]|uniref:Uncharacterized protein n=1 Tax=Tanacetum coccineum TaxID=301880 RepID=A0ABQ5HET0_9ASTR
MVNMVNQRKKYFARKVLRQREQIPMTHHVKDFISNILRIKELDAFHEIKVAEVKEEETVKRIGKRKKQKARKGIKIDKSAQEDSETDKEESVEAMNPTPLTTKSDSVANWKIFQQDFTREDLIELYRLVMQKYGTNRPEVLITECYGSDLWIMFDHLS